MSDSENSLLGCTDPVTYANTARINLKTAERKNPGIIITIILVEGKSDRRLYNQIFNPEKCIIEQVSGKKNVLEVIKILINEYPRRIIGLVDDDFDSLEGHQHSEPYIVTTDAHDFETQLIFSPALRKVSNTVLPDKKYSFLSQFVDELNRQLIKHGTILGYLRWLSKRDNLNLNFQHLPYKKIVNLNDKNIDISLVVDEILRNNKHLSLDKQDLTDKLNTLRIEKADPKFICQGHDLVSFLVYIIPEMLKSYIPKSDERSFLCSVNKVNSEAAVREKLILSYEMGFFRKTHTYSKIKGWEISNQIDGIMLED